MAVAELTSFDIESQHEIFISKKIRKNFFPSKFFLSLKNKIQGCES